MFERCGERCYLIPIVCARRKGHKGKHSPSRKVKRMMKKWTMNNERTNRTR